MARKFLKGAAVLSLVAVIFSFGAIDGSARSETDTEAASVGYAFGGIGVSNRADTSASAEANAKKIKDTDGYRVLRLYVGGMPFGVKFLTDGVIVAGFNENAAESGKNPARIAGIEVNDVITKVNGERMIGAEELNRIVGESKGKAINVEYSRDGKQYTVRLTPTYSEREGRYSIGIYVKDSGAGIGTVTFIVPKTQAFGGLGHGICDARTGSLIPMQRGSVVGVKISGIVKGLSGSPGEVKGYFNSGKTGTLLGNTDCGVYGVLAELPQGISEPMEVGLRDSVKEGRAYVYTQLDGERVEKYEIEISDIRREATGNKCYTVKVTDKRLISKTGGIIQGMSGSPIVQNGKIIGAVTHVLINDPTTGYGIFIENMLSQMGDLA